MFEANPLPHLPRPKNQQKARDCSVVFIFFFIQIVASCGHHASDAIVEVDNPIHSPPHQEEALNKSIYQPQLGVGVDFAETKTFRRCVTLPLVSTKHTMASRLYTESAIKDRTELNQALHIEASAGAKGLWGSGNGHAGYFKDVKMSSDAFYWLVNARYTLQDDGIDTGSTEFTLTDEAKRILAGPRGLVGFYEACGQYFYSGSQLGSHYALLYEFKSFEETTIEKIKASASYDGWGVQAKAEFEHFTQMAQKASVLKIHAASSGGSDKLRSYATHPEQLETELAILRQELYQEKKGVQTQWYMSDYNMFPEIQEAKEIASRAWIKPKFPTSNQFKDQALARLYRQYNRNINHGQLLEVLLEKSQGKEPLYYYKEENRHRMHTLLAAIEANNLAITTRAKECIFGSENDCLVTDLIDIDFLPARDIMEVFPPDEDYTTLQGWSVRFVQRRPNSPRFDLLAKSPDRGLITFDTDYYLYSSPLGIYARADEHHDFYTIIGRLDLVADPIHGQMRPDICVYNHAHVCSLRLIDTRPKGGDSTSTTHRGALKIQLVLFNKHGFVEKRTDFPSLD